ncbi:hypothetical protein ACFUMH_13835, partial [Cellulomonas sp. NPDC057328]|uniref:hypothetical protein n=1 Tax=Cellulomonas sp. NPDC057328 TaxID=3346101 RepID=UPI003643DED3
TSPGGRGAGVEPVVVQRSRCVVLHDGRFAGGRVAVAHPTSPGGRGAGVEPVVVQQWRCVVLDDGPFAGGER